MGTQLTVLVDIGARCLAHASATVSVLDPSNMQVPASADVSTFSDAVRAEVRFVGTVPGTYHVSARFEPNLGLVQVDALVFENRGERKVMTVDAGELAGCQHLELVGAERLLCLSPFVGTFAPRDGTAAKISEIPEAASAVRAGDAVWATRIDGGIAHWTLAPDLTMDAPGWVTGPAFAVTLPASSSELIVVDSQLHWARWAPDAGLAVRTYEGFDWHEKRVVGGWHDQGMVHLRTGQHQECVVNLDGGDTGCTSVFDDVIAYDLEGLWLWKSAPERLVLQRADEVASWSIPVYWWVGSEYGTTANAAPVLFDVKGTWYPIRYDGSRIFPESYGQTGRLLSVTRDAVAEIDAGVLTVWRR